MTDRAEGTAGSVPDLVAVVLAAGAGTRLRPLTDVRPKALCTVGGRPLLDLALERVAPHVRPYGGQRAPPRRPAVRRAGRPRRARRGRVPRGARHGRGAGQPARLAGRRRRAAHQRRRVLPGAGGGRRPRRRLGRRAAPAALRPATACPACSAASGTSAARCCPGGRSATWRRSRAGSTRSPGARCTPPAGSTCGPAGPARGGLRDAGRLPAREPGGQRRGAGRRARGRRPGRAGPLGGLGR